MSALGLVRAAMPVLPGASRKRGASAAAAVPAIPGLGPLGELITQHWPSPEAAPCARCGTQTVYVVGDVSVCVSPDCDQTGGFWCALNQYFYSIWQERRAAGDAAQWRALVERLHRLAGE